MKEPYPILKLAYNQNTYYDSSWSNNFFFVDYFGKVLSKTKYKFAKSFNDGYAFVYDYNNNWDIINSIGESALKEFGDLTKQVVQKAFKFISPLNGFFLKNYVVQGNIILSVNVAECLKEFDKIKINGVPSEKNSQGYLLINIYNSQKMYLIEDYSISDEGLMAIKHFDDMWRFITVKSFNGHNLTNYHFEESFEYASGFSNGLAKVKIGGLFGFINDTGKLVIPAIYDDARSFSEGYAAVAIANCRNVENWKFGKKKYDLSWNFIDKNNVVLFDEPKYNLTRLDSKKNYYFESENRTGYTFFWETLDENYFKFEGLKGYYGWETQSIGWPSRDFWYNSNILGQFSPGYLVDMLTAQNRDELGFLSWWVASWISKDRTKSTQNLGRQFEDSVGSVNAYNTLRNKKVVSETVYIDFDTTQSEYDYIMGMNQLETKYGTTYSDMKWITKIFIPPTSNYSGNFETDWSSYNDNLDMDQQDIDFWNQF